MFTHKLNCVLVYKRVNFVAKNARRLTERVNEKGGRDYYVALGSGGIYSLRFEQNKVL